LAYENWKKGRLGGQMGKEKVQKFVTHSAGESVLRKMEENWGKRL